MTIKEQIVDTDKSVVTAGSSRLTREVLSGKVELNDWKKYATYHVECDPDQDDRSREINLLSFRRPHMRAFHLSWFGFFIAFFVWFALSALLGEIRDDLGLSNQEIWTSSIFGVGGTVLMRLALGPLCDKFGPRVLFAAVLCMSSIPTACVGLVHTARGLSILRLFIGVAGGTFVTCQYWASSMFVQELVGTANALVGGWGNLGGGVTQLVMGSMLFPLFKTVLLEGDSELAWRTVCLLPAIVAFVVGLVLFYCSDDCPKGNYAELKRHGVSVGNNSMGDAMYRAACNPNTWWLSLHYACCFGVELTMNNTAALYFRDEFDQSTETAAAIASVFGWMNLFARGFGGYASDWANARLSGMQGRLWVHSACLFCEGLLVLIFSQTRSLSGAIFVMVFFSLFVQAAEGATYAIVPYVDRSSTGAIAGIVGAGGNSGAVVFGIFFREWSYSRAFAIMGFSVVASSFLTVFLQIKGYGTMLRAVENEMPLEDDEEPSDHHHHHDVEGRGQQRAYY